MKYTHLTNTDTILSPRVSRSHIRHEEKYVCLSVCLCSLIVIITSLPRIIDLSITVITRTF